MQPDPQRRLPVGAEPRPDGTTHFRVWAPRRRRVEVVAEGPKGDVSRGTALTAEANGYFSGVAAAASGTLYRFRLDGEEQPYPDPASRFQPQGPHGPSCVIDPHAFRWTDGNWRGRPLAGQLV